jgi:hypothetical protein
METCPVGLLIFRRRQGPCPALYWQTASHRYLCGLAIAPGDYLHWLPVRLHGAAGRLVSRRIAAGSGCDCDVEVSAAP